MGCKLTLVSAPAGFGKTTLITEWIQQSKDVAWLSLDESDNDPARFLTYFIVALNQVEGIESTLGKVALGMLQSSQQPLVEPVITSLINDISALPDRIILILDDYHLIDSSPVDNALTFLLEYLPSQMHLVIATRSDPFFPLSRLRGRGQVIDIRADDLRFSSHETTTFLNQVMGLALSGDQVATLETRTEGWIAGLQLAALSMRGQEDAVEFISAFAGDDRYISDYLVDEVLAQQSKDIKDFLLRTSILDRLTGSLCDSVTNREGSQNVLEELEHANLFIVPLDNRRLWYRYHHLFSDLLRQRLRGDEPERIFRLHCRASEWYECNGLINEAVKHSLAAKDFERAAHLINELAETLWACGEHTTLRRWLEELPDELVRSWPQLCTFHAWMLFMNGKLQAAEQSLMAAEQALDSLIAGVIEASADVPDHWPDLNVAKQRGMVAAIRAYMASWQGDVPGIIQFSHQALEYLPEEDSTWRCSVVAVLGDSHFWGGDMVAANRAYSEAMTVSKVAGDIFQIMLAGTRVVKVERLQGRLRQAAELCRHLSQLAEESGVSQTSTAGWSLAMWGEVLYEWNDLGQAKRFVEKCIELSERVHDLVVLGWGCLALVRILYGQSDLAGALGIIQKMEEIAGIRTLTWFTNRMAAWKARIWVAQGNNDPGRFEAAAQLLQERRINQDDEISFLREAEYLSLARLLTAQGKLEEATRLLERLLQTAKAGGQVGRVIEILVLCSLAQQAQGNSDQAMTTLKWALSLGEPEGYVRTFVDEGEPMKALLRQAASSGEVPRYVSKLLAAFEPDTAPEQLPSAPPLIEPLSERELQVLRLLKTELSGPKIARELVIALSTMRTHTQNIYSKLGVNNRRAAVKRAEELNLT